MEYVVIIEKAKNNFGAYVPDLPGCVAVGDTVEETLKLIKESVQFHLEGIKEDGEAIPSPSTQVSKVEVCV